MILHLDMDAFFASVEQLDNPDLVGKCVVVGGQSNRGVVAAASYEARKYGIHSAMPIFQARERCKDLVIVSSHRRRYSEISQQVMAILGEYSPLVEQISIDEAFVDITGCDQITGSTRDTALAIKKRIKEAVGLTCSVGAAPVKFLAKIASDMDKPDGLYIIRPDEVASFVQHLPVGKISGVGKKTRSALERLGIRLLGDVQKFNEQKIIARLGKFGYRLIELSRGIDKSKVTPHSPTKSISTESTLSANTDDKTFLTTQLLGQAEEVGRQLRRKAMKAKTVTLKLKYSDFKQITRSISLVEPTQVSTVIYGKAGDLLSAETLRKKVRLIGVGVSGLVPGDTPVQCGLFDQVCDTENIWGKVDEALDHIRGKFGKDIVVKASLRRRDESTE